MKKRVWKYGLFLALLLVQALLLTLALPTVLSAQAADATADFGRTDCAIGITPKSTAEGHPVVKGAQFMLYRVAEPKTEGTGQAWVLTEDFAQSGVDLGDLRNKALAGKLEEYASERKLAGAVQKADADGTVRFENLPTGLYLLVQKGSISGYIRIASFLVSVPMAATDGTSWLYRVDASPKTEARPGGGGGGNQTTPGGGSTPGGGPGEKPGPAGELTPVAAEELPTGALPQTGQLNWPVPLLAAGGILLFAAGWRLTFGRKNRDD